MQLTGCSPAVGGSRSTTTAGGAPFRQRQQHRRVNYQHLAKAGFSSPPASPSPVSSHLAATGHAVSSGAATLGAKRGRKPNALKLQQQKSLTSQSGAGNSKAGAHQQQLHSTTATTSTGNKQQPADQSNKTSQQFFHHQSTSSSNRSSSGSSNQFSNNDIISGNLNTNSQQQQFVGDFSAAGNNGAATPPPLRRGRGENRKCRKVYGMERRDLWCTQCKWKKACSRFCDQ